MACSSQSIQVQEIFKAVSSVTTSIVNDTKNQGIINLASSNNFKFTNGPTGRMFCKDVVITQVNNSAATITASTAMTDITQIKNQLTYALQQAAKTLEKETSDALAAGMGASASTGVTLDSAIANYVSTYISNTTESDMSTFISSFNQGEFINNGIIDCEGGSFNLTQENINKAVITTIVKSLTQNSVANSIKTKLEQMDDNTIETKFTNWIDSLTSLCGTACIATALCCMAPCIGIAICIIACSFGGKSKPPPPQPQPTAAFGKKLKKTLRRLNKLS
jgi:hypothetical protein